MSKKKSMGCGPLAALVIFVFVVLFVGGNEGVGFYYTNCDEEDGNFFSCLMDEMSKEDEEVEPEAGSVTAAGAYEYKGYSVTITMNIPLSGGAVTGTVSGTCDGKVKGTNAGGKVSGTMSGVCDPFFVNIPASATFSGTVNKSGKSIPIGFNGSGGGFSHQGATTLGW